MIGENPKEAVAQFRPGPSIIKSYEWVFDVNDEVSVWRDKTHGTYRAYALDNVGYDVWYISVDGRNFKFDNLALIANDPTLKNSYTESTHRSFRIILRNRNEITTYIQMLEGFKENNR